MALAYAGLDFEVREVVLKDKPAQMLAVSPKGTVPVLQMGDTVLDESIDVMRYALEQADPDGWLQIEPALWQWVEQCDHQFKPCLDRYKYHDRHASSQTEYRDACEAFLDALDHALESKPGIYLAGERLSVVDVAVFPFVRQFAHVDKPWFDAQPWPSVQGWLSELLSSSLFLKVMMKYPQWHVGDEPTMFRSTG